MSNAGSTFQTTCYDQYDITITGAEKYFWSNAILIFYQEVSGLEVLGRGIISVSNDSDMKFNCLLKNSSVK